MPFASSDVTVRRTSDEWWELVEELRYRGRDDEFLVPAGFPTDFATVPRPVVWLIPRFGRYTLAAILHDWLCTEGIRTGVVTSREADGIFRRVMREYDVRVLRRWLMWTGVRWGALFTPLRRPGWLHSAPGVLGISLLAAPVVVPPALLVLVASLLFDGLDRVVSPRKRGKGAPGPSRRTAAIWT